jgi:hypothetical protein
MEYAYGHLGLARDILQIGKYLADGHLARVFIVVVRPVE